MSTVPSFKDIAWEGGPRSTARLADWEAAVGRPIGELDVTTPELITIKPLYSSADLEGLEHLDGMPGFPPFVRGPYLTMYPGRPPPTPVIGAVTPYVTVSPCAASLPMTATAAVSR